ncbi:MAG: putative Ig domain-containing protein [Anaeromyxobacteraceae bacterium]
MLRLAALPALALLALAGCHGGQAAPGTLVEVPAAPFEPRLAPPAGLDYPAGPHVLALGMATALSPGAGTGGAAEAWSVEPPLPSGLSLDPSTGAVTGAPAALAPMAAYRVTARNAAGGAEALLHLAVLPPGDAWLSPAPGGLFTRAVWSFDARVAGGGAVRLEASAGTIDGAGGYVAPWRPGPAAVRAVPDGGGAAAEARFEISPRNTPNVTVRLFEPAGDVVEAGVLRISAGIETKYLLVRAEATLDGADVPLELTAGGRWAAAVQLGPGAGPLLLRVAGIDAYGGETELFRELAVSP